MTRQSVDGLVADRADVCEIAFWVSRRYADADRRPPGRQPLAVEAKTLEPVRLELVEQRPAGGFWFEAPALRRAGHGQLQASDLGQPSSPRSTRSGARSLEAAAPRSRPPTPERPSAPRYSAVVNSPVVRSISATPNNSSLSRVRSVAVDTIAMRYAGSRASRYFASVSVPGDTTRTTSRLHKPFGLLWDPRPARTWRREIPCPPAS